MSFAIIISLILTIVLDIIKVDINLLTLYIFEVQPPQLILDFNIRTK